MVLYVFHISDKKYGKHRIGLHRDDGLACSEYTSGYQAEIIRKVFIKIFKENFDLSITCEIVIHYISTFILTTLQI